MQLVAKTSNQSIDNLMSQIGATPILNNTQQLNSPPHAIANQSNLVKPGDIFCCIPGTKADGHSFAQDACNRGAAALLVERPLESVACPQFYIEDTRKGMAHLASLFYNTPSCSLNVVGITGTNGKTTCATLLAHILNYADKPAGTIGTLGALFNDTHIETGLTTPESTLFQNLLAVARDMGLTHVVCEISSHALALKRTFTTTFKAATFLNLTQDHLDYHKDLEDYFLAKAELFLNHDVESRIICIDDRWGEKLCALCDQKNIPYTTVSSNKKADIYVTHFEHKPGQSILDLDVFGENITLHTPLIGNFNIQNTAVVVALAHALNIETTVISKALTNAPQVPGRLEAIKNTAGPHVYVDYAHTPDALEKAIEAVKETAPQRLIVVVGCGGDRDTTKRKPMGEIATQGDIAVITSDNPRTEDPQKIIDMVLEGARSKADENHCTVISEIDRKKAIHKAITMANDKDAVLIAGKGHEDYQILGTTKHHLDDREEARRALDHIAQERSL